MRKRRQGVRFSSRVFLALGMIVFAMLIIFLSLHIGLSERGLRKLAGRYIESQEIDSQYYDNFESAGYTKDQYYALTEGDELTSYVADIFSELMSSVFKDTDSFSFTRDGCTQTVREILTQFNADNNISITEDQLDTLTTYTMDITGLTQMSAAGTPEEYENLLYSGENGEEYRQAYEILKTLLSVIFPVSLIIMYFICIVIAVISGGENERLPYSICNTIIYPSFFAIGISLGYIWGASNGKVITDFAFTVILLSSGISFTCGIGCEILVYILEKKTGGFNKWLKTIKKKRKAGKNSGETGEKRHCRIHTNYNRKKSEV